MRSLLALGLAFGVACGRVGFDRESESVRDGATDAIVIGDGDLARGCAGQPITEGWSFATDAAGWSYKANVGFISAMQWSDTIGHPEVGSLAIGVSSGSGGPIGWLYAPGSRDLRGRVASAWVRADRADVVAKIYGMNLPGNHWSDGGAHTLPPNVWTCVTFDVDAPSFEDPMFDASNVQEHGLHIEATAPVAIHVDSWGL